MDSDGLMEDLVFRMDLLAVNDGGDDWDLDSESTEGFSKKAIVGNARTKKTLKKQGLMALLEGLWGIESK